MKRTYGLFAALMTAFIPGFSHAFNLGTANDFNVFMLGSLSQSGTDSEGRVAAGGSVTLSSYSVASKRGGSTTTNLIAGGALVTTDGSVQGDVYASGAMILNNPTVFGNVSGASSVGFTSGGSVEKNVVYGSVYSSVGTTTVSGSISQGATSAPVDFAQEGVYLNNVSNALKNQTANGTADFQFGGFTLTGTNPTYNVFNINGADLSVANNFLLNAPAGSTVVINVSGAAGQMQYFGFSYTGVDRRNVLFNFYEATTLKLDGIGVEGSILAPKAAVNFVGGNINGTMVGASLIGKGEFHDHTFTGNLVPEPGAWAALAAGLAGIAGMKRRK